MRASNILAAVALAGLAALGGAHAGAVDLTAASFDAQVFESGKGAFVKFFAPWCGHCKSLAPAWNKLGDEFAESPTILIADVDCTKEADLCKKYGVSGYPTLKYFTGATGAMGDAYSGGRDFDALSAWSKENLGPSCGPENLDLCTEEQKASIKAVSDMTLPAIDKEIEEAEAAVKSSDTELEELLKSLQAQYEAGKTKKEEVVAATSPRLTLLRSVKRNKTAASGDAKEL
eukprot:CAMPEP_0197591044 /NCGR_PEP_ID=MMETSP1326-20131121/12621_1 /TAXON_ID=1155430 /ORGANISM="Genus nov. species nov., Strain RCC2288" /LENGTH=230 /DNA_ID=CAMNT_0043156383 /DNA_START=72 /DNA_END=764 /DNA_ORIENTATION=-